MIDWSRVDELRNDFGAEDFAEIAAMFLEEVEECLQKLMAGCSSNLADDFHFLKGSAANLGFAMFHDVCEARENDCSTSDITPLVEVFEKSKTVFLDKVQTG